MYNFCWVSGLSPYFGLTIFVDWMLSPRLSLLIFIIRVLLFYWVCSHECSESVCLAVLSLSVWVLSVCVYRSKSYSRERVGFFHAVPDTTMSHFCILLVECSEFLLELALVPDCKFQSASIRQSSLIVTSHDLSGHEITLCVSLWSSVLIREDWHVPKDFTLFVMITFPSYITW